MKETQELKARAGHLAKRTAKDWSSRDVATYASSIAFYFFMSMIPVLIIIIQVITRLGLSQRELLDFISRLIPETAYEFTAKIVSEAYKKTTGTISISALVLLWAASRATMALRCGLNKVYDKNRQQVREKIPHRDHTIDFCRHINRIAFAEVQTVDQPCQQSADHAA